jgi:ABC-type transport system substrate-binding protein
VRRLADSGSDVGALERSRAGATDMTTEARSDHQRPGGTMMLRHRIVFAVLASAAAALVAAVTPGAVQAQSTFRSALLGEPPHIDPQRMADFGSFSVTSQVYSTLTILDDKLQIVPYAAKSWTVSPDGLTWTFKLRDNLVFHNGRKADANDVKYSLSRLASPDSRSPSSFLLLSDVVGFEAVNKQGEKELSGVRVVDPLTVEIKLQSPPKGDLATRLSHISMAIIAKEAVEAGGQNWAETNPIGTGPWKLKEWAHRSKVVYDAFPQFFEGKPKVDRLEMPIVPEAATQLAMYQNGELDVVLVPIGDYPRLKADPRFSKEMKVWDRAQVQFLALNPRVYAPFKDVRVRQAFAQAIDKQKVINQVFHGLYIPSNGMLPPGVPGFDAGLKALPYDPARAKQLLADAGFPDGKGLPPLTMTVNPVTGDYRMMAEPIAAMLKDTLGVSIEVQLQEFASFTAAMNRRDALASFMTGWSATTLDAGYFHELWLYSKSPLNRVNYESAAFDKLIEQANSAPDKARRIGFIKQADELITKDVPLIPVMYTRFVYLISPKVKGLEQVPLSLGFNTFRAVEVAR